MARVVRHVNVSLRLALKFWSGRPGSCVASGLTFNASQLNLRATLSGPNVRFNVWVNLSPGSSLLAVQF